jgi:hypothetical protein
MTLLVTLYVILAFAALIALSMMILKIGTLLGDCPQAARRAQAASITIATGFSAIGAGGIILIAVILPILPHMPAAAFLAALGLASLCLGLGFTHAVATLRAVMVDGDAPATKAAEAVPA